MSIYRVTGTRAYRGHEPGQTFETNLSQSEEMRAVRRGSIVLVERSDPSLRPGSYRLPRRGEDPPMLGGVREPRPTPTPPTLNQQAKEEE